MHTKPIYGGAKIKLMWNNVTYDLEIDPAAGVPAFKRIVQEATGVPPDRQKLLGGKLWSGILRDDADLTKISFKEGSVVSLVGTADVVRSPVASTAPMDPTDEVIDDEPHDATTQSKIKEIMDSLKSMTTEEQRESRKKYLNYKMIDIDLDTTFNDCLNSYTYSHINPLIDVEPSFAQPSSIPELSPMIETGVRGELVSPVFGGSGADVGTTTQSEVTDGMSLLKFIQEQPLENRDNDEDFDPWPNDDPKTYSNLSAIKKFVLEGPKIFTPEEAIIVLNAVFALFLKGGNSANTENEHSLYAVEDTTFDEEQKAVEKLFFIKKYSDFVNVVSKIKISVNGEVKPLEFTPQIQSNASKGFYMPFFKLFIVKQRVLFKYKFGDQATNTEFYGPITITGNKLDVNFVNGTYGNAGIFQKNGVNPPIQRGISEFKLKFSYPALSELSGDQQSTFKDLYNYEVGAFATIAPSADGQHQSWSKEVPQINISTREIEKLRNLENFKNSTNHMAIFYSYILYLIFKKSVTKLKEEDEMFKEYEVDEGDENREGNKKLFAGQINFINELESEPTILLPFHYFDFFQMVDVGETYTCFLRNNFVEKYISNEFNNYVTNFNLYLFKELQNKAPTTGIPGIDYINNSLCIKYPRKLLRGEYVKLHDQPGEINQKSYLYSDLVKRRCITELKNPPSQVLAGLSTSNAKAYLRRLEEEIDKMVENGFMEYSEVYEIQGEPVRDGLHNARDAIALTNANRILNPHQVRSHTVNSITNRLNEFSRFENDFGFGSGLKKAFNRQMARNPGWASKEYFNAELHDYQLKDKFLDQVLPSLDSYNEELGKLKNETYFHQNHPLNHIPVLFDGKTDYNINVYFNTTEIIDFRELLPNVNPEAFGNGEEESTHIKIAAFLNVLSYQTTNVVNDYIENSYNPDSIRKTYLYTELQKTRMEGGKVQPIRHLMALYPDVDHGVYSEDSELIEQMNVFKNNKIPKEDINNTPEMEKIFIESNQPYFDKLIFSKTESVKHIYYPMQHHIHVFGIFSDETFANISELYIIFRGSYTLKDWIDIDKAIQNGVGFSNARLNDVKYTLRVISKSINKYLNATTKVIISGHSLGGFLGAYATIAVKNIFKFGQNIPEQIFQPRRVNKSTTIQSVRPENIIPILFDPFFPEYKTNTTNTDIGNVTAQIRFANKAAAELYNDLEWFKWGGEKKLAGVEYWSPFEGTFPKYCEHFNNIDNGWIVRVVYDLASYSLYYSMLKNEINGGIKMMNINSCVETIDKSYWGSDVVHMGQYRNSHAMSHYVGAKQYSEIYGWGITCENSPRHISSGNYESLLLEKFNPKVSPQEISEDSEVQKVNNLISRNRNGSLFPILVPGMTEDKWMETFNFFKTFITDNSRYYGENRRVSPFTQNILFNIELNHDMYPRLLELIPDKEKFKVSADKFHRNFIKLMKDGIQSGTIRGNASEDMINRILLLESQIAHKSRQKKWADTLKNKRAEQAKAAKIAQQGVSEATVEDAAGADVHEEGPEDGLSRGGRRTKKHHRTKKHKKYFSKKMSKTRNNITRRLRRMKKHSTRYRK